MTDSVTFQLNGRQVTVAGEGGQSLLDLLRNTLALKATRMGCGQGQCGACRVMLDGHAVAACETPLWAIEGKAVTTLEGLFTDATAFNQPLGSWNVSQVTSLAWMFLNAASFNQPLNTWSTANVTSLFGTFFGATLFNQPLGNWNTSSVIELTSTFRDAAAFDQPLGTWSVASVVEVLESARTDLTLRMGVPESEEMLDAFRRGLDG